MSVAAAPVNTFGVAPKLGRGVGLIGSAVREVGRLMLRIAEETR